ncbi:MAG: DUF2953 domain-containing protein [Gammaproteobacteria bacterium]|nr:DUF2953 domain-containing protein [Gammaproteobacteria bacterium]
MLVATGVFLLVIVAALAAPVSMRFNLAFQDKFYGTTDIRMFYGLVKTRAHFPTPVADEKTDSTPSRKPAPTRSATARRNSVFAALRHRPFRRRILRFITAIWKAIDKQDICLRMRVGLGDPADTGRLWAVAGPASGYFSSLQRYSIVLEPEFFNATFECDGSGHIRFTPLTLISHAAALALSPAIWRGVRQHRTASA